MGFPIGRVFSPLPPSPWVLRAGFVRVSVPRPAPPRVPRARVDRAPYARPKASSAGQREDLVEPPVGSVQGMQVDAAGVREATPPPEDSSRPTPGSSELQALIGAVSELASKVGVLSGGLQGLQDGHQGMLQTIGNLCGHASHVQRFFQGAETVI